MNNTDLHNLLQQTRDAHASLPLHQERLRAQLIARYKQTDRDSFRTFVKGVITMKKILTVGLPVTLVAVFAFVGLTFMDPRPATARDIIEGASKVAYQMTPEEIEQIGKEYKQNVIARLEEAKLDADLKIMSDADLEAWGFRKKTDGYVKTHLGYVDDAGHRIIFGVNSQNEPVFVYDVDMSIEDADGTGIPPKANMQVN